MDSQLKLNITRKKSNNCDSYVEAMKQLLGGIPKPLPEKPKVLLIEAKKASIEPHKAISKSGQPLQQQKPKAPPKSASSETPICKASPVIQQQNGLNHGYAGKPMQDATIGRIKAASLESHVCKESPKTPIIQKQNSLIQGYPFLQESPTSRTWKPQLPASGLIGHGSRPENFKREMQAPRRFDNSAHNIHSEFSAAINHISRPENVKREAQTPSHHVDNNSNTRSLAVAVKPQIQVFDSISNRAVSARPEIPSPRFPINDKPKQPMTKDDKPKTVEQHRQSGEKPVQEPLFSLDNVSTLPFHNHLIQNITEKFGVSHLTAVQTKAIPLVVEGKDCLVKSQTGSGKTFVYALPIINYLGEKVPAVLRTDGVYCIVILPTRELAIQSFDVVKRLCQSFIRVTPGLLNGGEKKKSEKARIRKGINILVGTPGRILDHLKSTSSLATTLQHFRYLVIDEADRLLEVGFQSQVEEIIGCLTNILRPMRPDTYGQPLWQSILLSATLTPAVERLAHVALHQPEYIDISLASSCGFDDAPLAVPANLRQYYVVTPIKYKLSALAAFLEVRSRSKILVFLPTQDIVEFVFSLLDTVLSSNMTLSRLHGEMAQPERADVFHRFEVATNACLLATDVAARGLDIPSVEWVVQWQAAESPAIYVQRAGRTARAGKHGSCLLMLTPTEKSFVSMLKTDHGLQTLRSTKFSSLLGKTSDDLSSEAAASEMHRRLQAAVDSTPKLLVLAQSAYVSFVRMYATYKRTMKSIFHIRRLNLGHIARSMCLKDDLPSEINAKVRDAMGGDITPFSGPPRQPRRRIYPTFPPSDSLPEPIAKKSRPTVGGCRRQQTCSEFSSGL